MLNEAYRNGCVVALGMFDGMHMGHRELIMRTVSTARSKGLRSLVYTFSNHPLSVIGTKPTMLMGMEERRAIMLSLGADETVFVEFTRNMADMEPLEFVRMLIRDYNAKCIATGFNYTFGRMGAGDPKLLKQFGRDLGFDVISVEPIMFNGEVVSSSRIREDILGGNMNAVNRMLCAPYSLNCTVVRQVAAPRFAFELTPDPTKVLPAFGTYAVDIASDGVAFGATLHIDLESQPGWTLTSSNGNAMKRCKKILKLSFHAM